MQPQQPQSDMPTLTFRIAALEKDVQQLQSELRLYVPQRENELQLKNIQEIVRRIESDVQDAKKQITTVSTKLENQGQKTNDIQFGALKSVLGVVVSIIIGVLITVLANYLMHPGG